MFSPEIRSVAAALDQEVLAATALAGGFSHSTWLVSLAGGPVVARFGGGDPAIEAAVMAVARSHAPVPEVLLVCPSAMVIEYVEGTPLSQALAEGGDGMADLGAEVGRVIAGIAEAGFDRAGFFTGPDLAVGEQPPWSEQLAPFAEACMAKVPETRLDPATRRTWAKLCAEHAPALTAIDDQARLAHGDVNPKNILVTRAKSGWRVDAVLDWEFSYAGCPFADAANMARFGQDYPDGFLDAFLSASGATGDGLHLGRILDMFALSDLVTRAPGHEVADQAATIITSWSTAGIPDSP